jgi:signal transduction histidine kinase
MRLFKRRVNTIRSHLMLLFLTITVLSGGLSLYVFFTFSTLTDNLGDMFDTSIRLEQVLEDLDEAHESLYLFLSTRNNGDLLRYSRASDRLSAFSDAVLAQHTTDMYMKDIANMVPTYLRKADEAVGIRRGRDPAYIDLYMEANATLGHIRRYAEMVDLRQLRMNTTLYRSQSRFIDGLKIASVLLLAGMVMLSVLLVRHITYKLTDPITRLSRAAAEIAEGNYDTAELPVAREEEIRGMTQAFNQMKENVRDYIRALHDKSEAESQLHEQQVTNLRMQSLLDTSRLQALQAQINPHFLFNTLNAGIQLSMMEGSDRTTVFLENLSDLFRYNIRNPDTSVSLREEILHVRAYTELMQVRFGDAITFLFDIDETGLEAPIPPLSIQTVVENACIHGLGERGTGTVRVRVMRQEAHVRVSVSDDGTGIDPDVVRDIFARSAAVRKQASGHHAGHTTGIGLANVIQRLRLLTGEEDVLEILSSEQVGTTVSIRLKLPPPEQSQASGQKEVLPC